MGVIIDTASRVVDKFAAGVHGFTAGVPQSGLPATELSDDWCDGVQQEINNAIEGAEDAALDNADRGQLAAAIDYQNRNVYPRVNVTSTYYWRGHATAGAGAAYRRHEESGFRVNCAPSTVYDLVGLLIPTNSQATVIMRGSLVRSDSMTVYGNCIFAASVRNSAGTYTLQSSATLLSNQNFASMVMSPIASAGIYLRFDIPASLGNVFNIFATISAEVVVWG